MQLPTAETFYGPRLRRGLGRVALAADDSHGDARWVALAGETGLPVPYWACALYGDPVQAAPAGDDTASPLAAHVRRGRWLVQCECGSCQYASHLDRRFYCVHCRNDRTNGLYRPVVWPNDPAAIERALLKRPAERRHWLPHETVTDLKRQNRLLAETAA